MTDFELPESITSENPKEAIAFCIAHGIQAEVLPPGFNMRTDGYTILEELILNLNKKGTTDEKLTEIIIVFVAGYAAGSGQIGAKQ